MCMSPKVIKTPVSNLGIFKPAQEFIEVPCGKCDECRVSHAKEWAVRCMCEYYSRPDDERARCWFLTLTYDELHNDGLLHPIHLTKFIKALRKRYKNLKLKYFVAGEFGSRSYRPHYHMIIYNLPIDDLERLRFKTDLFTSKYIEKTWGRGIISIGQVSLQSCNYVARYALKKNTSDCFIRMSYGFGKQFFLNKMKDIVSNNYLTLPKNGKIMKASIPRYFMKIYRSIVGDDEYAKWLKWRLKKIKAYNSKIEIAYSTGINRIDYINRLRLGVPTAAQLLHRESKKILNQALFDFYHQRDLS